MKIPRKTWLYFLLDANNISITWDAFAQMPVKQSLLNPKFIPQNPSGWQDIVIQAATNLKYFSLNRTFITSLKFINDGANILRWYSYNDRGYDENLYVVIYQWNHNTGQYEEAYKGKLDFTGFSDNVETGVTMSTKEGGVLEYLNANDGVTYDIRCDDSNAAIQYINFQQGINLEDTFNYQFIEAELGVGTGSYFSSPFVFLNNEGDSIGIIKNESPFGIFASQSDLIASEDYVMYSIYGLTINIEGELTLQAAAGVGTISVKWLTDLGQEFVLYDETRVFTNENILIDITQTIALAPYEKLYFALEINDVFAVLRATPKSTDFTIKFISVNAPSKSYSLTWYDWYKQMVLKLSDGKYTGDSQVLSERLDLVVTCGDALRNTDRAVVPAYNIASSFSDGFKSMSSILDLALEIREGVLWIEQKTTVYASDPNTQPKIFELGEISDVTIETATDLLINSIECGFPDQQYDERNGKYEFNSEQEWKAPVTLTAQQVFDIRSVWRGDAFGIEFIRAALTKLETTDNAGDKQPFMVQVEAGGGIPECAVAGIKGAESNVIGDVQYDTVDYTGDSENYISNNAQDSEFTYINTIAQNAVISANLYLQFTGTGTITVEFRINGVAIDSLSYSAATVFQRVDFIENLLLNTNDVITINISNGGATVNVQSAGLFIEFPVVAVISIHNIYRDAYSSIMGVLDNTVYNVNFSPHRQLLYHSAYLAGLFIQMQMDSLKITTYSKNADLTTVLGGVVIAEKADIQVRDLLPALFLPYYAAFKCRPQYSFARTITAINGGYIHCTLNGNELFLLAFGEMSAKPALNEVQEWKLLLAPNNILSNLLKLSQQGLFLEYMGNLLFISDLNPVHFVKYDYTPSAAYSYKDMYDDWVRKRNERFDTQPNYIQRWKLGDPIELQFITANLGGIEIDVKDCDGLSVFSQSCTAITDPAIQPPYGLQQCSITGLGAGNYYIIISYAGSILAISEMQKFSESELAYRYDYSSTYNKLYGYFTQWRPCMRVDSMFMQWQPQCDFEEYEDDPGDVELINANVNRSRNLILGTNDGIGGSGLPDFMMNKMNEILLLNNTLIEGEHYVRSTDSKLEPTQRSGNPFDFYTVQVQKAKNEKGLSFTGIDPLAQNGIISYTLDATGFGMNDTILTIEVEDES